MLYSFITQKIMCNFKQASFLLITMITVQPWLHASDVCRKHSYHFLVYLNQIGELSYLEPEQQREYKITKDAYGHYLKLINNQPAKTIAWGHPRDERQDNLDDFNSYITRWLSQHNINSNYKEFNEYVADYPIPETGFFRNVTLLEYALSHEGYQEVIIDLTRHGANFNKPVFGFDSPSDYAKRIHNYSLERLLGDIKIEFFEKKYDATKAARRREQELKVAQAAEAELQKQKNHITQSIPKVTRLQVDFAHDDWSWKDRFN